MRTTLDLDEDILLAAKQLALQRGKTAGQVISELARQALQPKTPPRVRNGVPLFVAKAGGRKATMAAVNQLRDAS